jgi:acyl carrier protein
VDDIIDAIRQTVSENYGLQLYAVALLKARTIPKTSSGKIQRRACREQLLADKLDTIAGWRLSDDSLDSADFGDDFPRQVIPPENPQSAAEIEDWLTDQLADALSIAPEQVDRNLKFVQLGVGSLAAVKLISQVEVTFDIVIKPEQLFGERSTLSDLAAYLHKQLADQN